MVSEIFRKKKEGTIKCFDEWMHIESRVGVCSESKVAPEAKECAKGFEVEVRLETSSSPYLVAKRRANYEKTKVAVPEVSDTF